MTNLNVMTNRNVFRQSNVLVNARYKMSSISLNIFFLILTEINAEEEESQLYRFKISDIEKRINKRLDRRYLEKISDELTGYGIKILKENGGFLTANMLSSFEYIKNKGIIELEISKKIEPYVLKLSKNFTKSSLTDISSMQSEYSQRLFLMFEQRKNLGEWKVDLEELQNILCVSKSMKPFGVFNRDILSVALRDINKSSSIRVELLKTIKEGRTVKSLCFKIKKINNKKNKKNKKLEEFREVLQSEEYYMENVIDVELS